VSVAPTFLVTDASGNALQGVPVTVSVASGGGTLTDAPTRSMSAATPIGSWTLGPSVGAQSITVTVDGLTPLTISAAAVAGAPSQLVPLSATTVSGRVGEAATQAPSVRVVDQFNNVVAGAMVTVASPNLATTTLTADAQGIAVVPAWIFPTVPGQSVLAFSSGTATVSFIANVTPGDPAAIAIDGLPDRAMAGSTLSSLVVRMTDKYGNTVPNAAAGFNVVAGGGSLAPVASATRTDGAIAIPAWTLGKSAVPQTLHVDAGAFAKDVTVPIASDYTIDVRFFGGAMTDQQKAWFTNAASRISGAIVGDVPDVRVTNLDAAAACGIVGLPTLNETIDDIVIFASVQPIDGAGKILAESGPCVFRNPLTGGFSTIGVMLFDSADIATMASQGITQDVITHEMLHVVGIGTMWDAKNLLTGEGTPGVAYWGAAGIKGCVSSGGAVTCGSSVPVENNGVPGTTDSHWRESTFGNELMTGYVNVGVMPFSAITVGSLGDMGYQVNLLAADPYRIPGTGVSASVIPGFGAGETWEKLPPGAIVLGTTPSASPRVIRKP
jgi:hypothetical protein